MATKETTLAELVHEAIEKLPPARRFAAKIRMRSERYKNQVYAEIGLKLSEDNDCPCREVFGAEGFAAAQTFAIDLDNLDKILALIVKYLPTILELVLKFVTIMLAFLSLAVASSSAFAQTCYVDAYGRRVCETPRMSRAEAPIIAPIVNALQVALPPYVPVIREADMYRVGCEVPVAAPVIIKEEVVFEYDDSMVMAYHDHYRIGYRQPFRRLLARIYNRVRGR